MNGHRPLPPTALSALCVRVYAALSATALGLGFIACGSGQDPTPEAPPAITQQPQGATTVLPDQPQATFQITATGNPAPGYQWRQNGSPVTGATSARYIFTAVSTADDGSRFSVQVQNPSGSVTSSDALLTVNRKPEITKQPESVNVSEGQAATFSITASGKPAVTFQWKQDGTDIPGAQAASYTTPVTTLANQGAAYSVQVSNSVGSLLSQSAHLTTVAAIQPPAITTQPQGGEFHVGDSVVLKVAASGAPLFSFTWKKDGVVLTGATTDTCSLSPAQLTDTGTYRVAVANAAGSAVSADANISVVAVDGSPAMLVQPVDTAVLAGNPAVLSAAATGAGTLKYQWQQNRVDLPGATLPTCTIPAVTAGQDQARIRCVVSNSVGTATSSEATLTVHPVLPGAFRFVVYGDSRGTSVNQLVGPVLGEINARIRTLVPAPQFVVFLGDMCFRGKLASGGQDRFTFEDWISFMGDPTTGLPSTLPVYVVKGNHELYQSGQSGTYFLENQVEYQKSFAAMAGITTLKGYENLAYWFTSADQQSLFVALDSYFLDGGSTSVAAFSGTVDEAQLAWLDSVLAASSARHKFVLLHTPTFNPQSRIFQKCENAGLCSLWTILNRHQARLCFVGHVHLYSRKLVDATVDPQWTWPLTQVISGGAGAEPDQTNNLFADASWHVGINFNFSVVDLSGGIVNVTSYVRASAGTFVPWDTFSTGPNGSTPLQLGRSGRFSIPEGMAFPLLRRNDVVRMLPEANRGEAKH